MKARWRTLIAVAAVGLVAAIALGKWRRADWRFVERATGFEFPAGTEYLAQYDNAEWYVVSVVRLPADAVAAFAQKHRFAVGSRSMVTTEGLPANYREIPKRADLLSAAGRSEYQAWDAILDQQTKLLWIHVGYPDPGGMHPGTAPKPPNKAPEPTP